MFQLLEIVLAAQEPLPEPMLDSARVSSVRFRCSPQQSMRLKTSLKWRKHLPSDTTNLLKRIYQCRKETRSFGAYIFYHSQTAKNGWGEKWLKSSARAAGGLPQTRRGVS